MKQETGVLMEESCSSLLVERLLALFPPKFSRSRTTHARAGVTWLDADKARACGATSGLALSYGGRDQDCNFVPSIGTFNPGHDELLLD